MQVKNILFRSKLQHTMTQMKHTISLHNLPIAAEICWNIPPIIWCLRISLLGPGARLEQLSEPSHRRKIVCHPNAFSISRIHEHRRAPDRDCTVTSLSETVKSVQLSSYCWHYFTMAGRDIAHGPYCLRKLRSCFAMMPSVEKQV